MRRGPLSIGVDPDLRFDLMFYRKRRLLLDRLRSFRPDLIHVIGPGELGILGALAAYHLRIPLVASWHTNVHEYAGRRLPFGSSRIAAWWSASSWTRFCGCIAAHPCCLRPVRSWSTCCTAAPENRRC
jgi:hypothetical protein